MFDLSPSLKRRKKNTVAQKLNVLNERIEDTKIESLPSILPKATIIGDSMATRIKTKYETPET